MSKRFLISVAAIALMAGAGAVNAQGMKNEGGGGAGMQQTAPSTGGGAGAAPTQKSEGMEHGKAGAGSDMKASQTEKSPGAMKNQHAAFFRYSIGSHPVTLYIYNARRVPLRGVLEPRVVHNQPIHVGDRRGYSIAAREQRGVGYAIATDMNDDESAELVSAVF